jgi:hypothetical protein
MAAMKEGPRGLVAPDGRVLKGAQRVVKEMAEEAAKNLTRMLNDLAQLKAPGRCVHLPKAAPAIGGEQKPSSGVVWCGAAQCHVEHLKSSHSGTEARG